MNCRARLTNFSPQSRMVVDLLGHDVARPSQSLLHIWNFFVQESSSQLDRVSTWCL